MIESMFRVFLSTPDEEPKQLFEGGVTDEDFKEGLVGLTTFATRATFDSFTIKPIGDLPEEKEEAKEKVDQEIEDVKVKEAGTNKNQQVFQNEKDNKRSWKLCL